MQLIRTPPTSLPARDLIRVGRYSAASSEPMVYTAPIPESRDQAHDRNLQVAVAQCDDAGKDGEGEHGPPDHADVSDSIGEPAGQYARNTHAEQGVRTQGSRTNS